MVQEPYPRLRASRPATPALPRLRLAPLAAGLREAALQVDTGFRSAANTITFGGADHFAAGMDALIAPGGLGEWPKRYNSNLAREQARSRYDAENRQTAVMAGQLAVAALAMGRGRAPTVRLPGAARLSRREKLALLGAGAGGGMGMQTVSDAASGRRSSLADLGGAALGGVAGVVALPLGPRRAAVIDGWVTSAGQDVLNQRSVALERAGQSAFVGGTLGGLAGDVGRAASDRLPAGAKGRLGETLGDLRSTISGHRRELRPKTRDALPDGDYWYPDGRSGDLRFEDKFGYRASLSPNQERAQAVLGRNFMLYHFTPDDIGAIASMPASATSPHGVDAIHERRNGR